MPGVAVVLVAVQSVDHFAEVVESALEAGGRTSLSDALFFAPRRDGLTTADAGAQDRAIRGAVGHYFAHAV
jgi:hypothetical protein